MTRDELNRRRMMFQINAKKNNLLKPEYEVQNPNVLRHSATNDYLEFRKKVAQGAKMQKEAKVNLFNVTEANEQYRQELADKTILIHTGAGGMTNAYVAKLDDFYGPGKPRYFYTKEEWEGYQRNKQGASQAGAQRGAKEGADAKNKDLATSAADAYAKSKANEVKQQIKEGFNKLTGKNKPDLVGGREAAEKAGQKTMQEQATIESNKNKAREIGRDSKRWEKYNTEVGNIVLKNILNSDPRFKEMKKNVDFANYPGGPEKGFNDLEEAVKKGIAEYEKNAAGTKNAGADRAKKESAVEKEAKADDRAKKLEDQQNKREEAAKSGTKTTESYTEQVKRNTDFAKEMASKNDDGSLDEAGKDYINWVKEESLKNLNSPEFYQIKKDVVKDAKKPGATVKDLANKYGLKEDYVNYLVFNETGKSIPEDKDDLDAHRKTNALYNKWSKEYSIANSKKGVKHNGLEDGITTSAELTPEQEYLSFRQKVESGLKHFGQTRGLISIPINQALKNGESLAHAGITNKYYAKIDDFWGKGKPRYFYSKEEWDGYQKNKQGAGQAGADRAVKQKEEASKIETKSYSDKKFENDLKNKSLAEASDNAYQKTYRNELLKKAQSGREAAMKNSGSLTNPIKKFAQDVETKVALAKYGISTNSNINDGIPKIVAEAQSRRETAEKDATKRTMTDIAYNNAIKEYNPVATEVNKKYGFDKMGPEDKEARVKALTKVIKDVNKVISKDKIDNPNNVKFDSSYDDNNASYDIYIPKYKNALDQLYSTYNELQNEYAKTLQTAQAMHDFDAVAEANRHAGELFDQMTNINNQIKDAKKEQDSKVLPYMTAIYKELL